MLVFVHIPKTAGTTLHKVISHQYPAREILIRHDTDGPIAEAIPRGCPKLPGVVMGHLSVGLHRYHPDVRYITCLREPVARLVSHYHHASNDPAHYLHEAIVRDKLGLADYIARGISGELTNGMTRMLAGVEDFHHGAIGPATLDKAKHYLEVHFDAVVLSEHFDEGLVLLAAKLGWTTPWYIRRKVGHYPTSAEKPDAGTRQKIEDLNSLDMELYRWARERFIQEAKSISELKERTMLFKRRNEFTGKAVFVAREIMRRTFGRKWG